MTIICAATWVITAIQPENFQAWALEQIASILGIGSLWFISRHAQLSLIALSGLTFLFVAHAIGTHHTYSMTPYDGATEYLFGFSLNETFGWQRNHYDRFVHLIFGVTASIPLYQIFFSQLKCSNSIAWFLSLNIVVSLSAAYELLEWFAALVFSPETGDPYLGSQGDIWDAQADIAIAGLGALLVCMTWRTAKYIRDHREFNIHFTTMAPEPPKFGNQ